MFSRLRSEISLTPLNVFSILINTPLTALAYFKGLYESNLRTPQPNVSSGTLWFGLSIILGIAGLSGWLLKRWVIASFFFSLIGAGLTLVLASLASRTVLSISLHLDGDMFSSPMINIFYWLIVLIFCMVNGDSLVRHFRYSVSSANIANKNSTLPEDSFAGPLALFIIWTLCLHVAQRYFDDYLFSHALENVKI
jgi:hypothetical protein